MITHIIYQDAVGRVIYEEPMIFSRLYAAGQDLVINYIRYTVLAVVVEGDTQKVTIRRLP